MNGDIQATEVTATSDVRYKTAITPLDGALETVLQLRGVNYQWRQDEYPAMHFHPGIQIGMIAQEVEAVVPELVSTGQDGYKSLNYNKLPALLVEAIKAQQARFEAQDERIRQLEDLVDRLLEQ